MGLSLIVRAADRTLWEVHEPPRPLTLTKLLRTFVFLGCVAAVWALLIAYFVRNPWSLVIVGALLVLGLAAAFSDGVSKLLDVVFRGYFVAMIWLLIALAPILVARYAADLVASWSVAPSLLVLAIWAFLLYLALFPAWREDRRRTLLVRLRHAGGRAATALYGVALLGMAVIFFGSLTWFLAERGWVRFSAAASGHAVEAPVQVADLFLWQTLDSVPGLKVTDTLRWRPPLTYTDGRLGMLVIAFKAVVLLPVVAMLSTSWRGRGRPLSVDEPAPLLPPWFPRSPRNRAVTRALHAVERAAEQVDVARHRMILARNDTEVRAAVEVVNRCELGRAGALAALATLVDDDEETARRSGATPHEVRTARRTVPPEVAEERLAAMAPRYGSWRRLLFRAKTWSGSGRRAAGGQHGPARPGRRRGPTHRPAR